MKKPNNLYPFMVWLLSLVIGPVIMLMDLLVKDHFMLENGEYDPVDVIFSGSDARM